MRKYKFEEYYKKNLPVFSIIRAEVGGRKTVKRKPRSEEEWKVFFILTKDRWKRWLKDRLVEKTGERRYRMKI